MVLLSGCADSSSGISAQGPSSSLTPAASSSSPATVTGSVDPSVSGPAAVSESPSAAVSESPSTDPTVKPSTSPSVKPRPSVSKSTGSDPTPVFTPPPTKSATPKPTPKPTKAFAWDWDGFLWPAVSGVTISCKVSGSAWKATYSLTVSGGRYATKAGAIRSGEVIESVTDTVTAADLANPGSAYIPWTDASPLLKVYAFNYTDAPYSPLPGAFKVKNYTLPASGPSWPEVRAACPGV